MTERQWWTHQAAVGAQGAPLLEEQAMFVHASAFIRVFTTQRIVMVLKQKQKQLVFYTEWVFLKDYDLPEMWLRKA